MVAVVDFGNTWIKTAFFEDGTLQWVHTGSPSEQWLRLWQSWLKRFSIECIAWFSVREDVQRWIKPLCDIVPCFELHTQIVFPPLKMGYRTPETLGIDRWCNVVGAWQRLKRFPFVVVSCGTALTIDYVDSQGVYHGGSIAPGLRMRYQALHHFTQKLPLLSLTSQAQLPGKTTQEAIHAGVLIGMYKEIQGILAYYRSLERDLSVIFTGNAVVYLALQWETPIFVAPFLSLEGGYALWHSFYRGM